MPSTLSGCARMASSAVAIAVRDVRRAPIAGELRIEHVAEPVDDHRLARLGEQAVVDLEIVVGRARHAHERAARHQDDRRARRLDRLELLLVGADHVIDAPAPRRGRGGRCRRRWRACGGPSAFAAAAERRISSSAFGQSSPMPRCAVSIASATEKPSAQRWRR